MPRLKQLVTTEFWSQGERPWYPALGVSTLLHVGVVLALGLLWTQADRGASRPVESRWSPDSTVEQQLELTTLALPSPEQSPDPGGRSSTTASLETAEEPDVAPPDFTELVLEDHEIETLLSEHLTQTVGPSAFGTNAFDVTTTGDGQGTGDGSGDGEGRAFFGMRPDGQRFVYVVDCSRSMNHPHESQWKTRFRRVQFEILQSVGHMSPDQEFFIIFFSDRMHPMPASAMQPATPQLKQRYLRWMSGWRADGDTDPLDAMRLALRLQPDVIYFLTDGSFEHRTNEELTKLRQQRTAIHTFCFGDAAGEEVLQFIARSNRGEYHFVP